MCVRVRMCMPGACMHVRVHAAMHGRCVTRARAMPAPIIQTGSPDETPLAQVRPRPDRRLAAPESAHCPFLLSAAKVWPQRKACRVTQASRARVCTTHIPSMPKAERRPQDELSSRRSRSTSSLQGNKVPPQRSRMHAVDMPCSGFFLTAPRLDCAPAFAVDAAMDEGPPPAPRWRPSLSSSLRRPSSLLPKPDPELVAAAEAASETAGAHAATASASLDDLLLGRISIAAAAAASAAAAAAADKAWAASEAARASQGPVRLPAADALSPAAQPQARRAALDPGRPRQREVSKAAAADSKAAARRVPGRRSRLEPRN